MPDTEFVCAYKSHELRIVNKNARLLFDLSRDERIWLGNITNNIEFRKYQITIILLWVYHLMYAIRKLPVHCHRILITNAYMFVGVSWVVSIRNRALSFLKIGNKNNVIRKAQSQNHNQNKNTDKAESNPYGLLCYEYMRSYIITI